MADIPKKPHLGLNQKTDLRTKATLLARVQTAQLLRMSEPEMANLIKQIEHDPLFTKLLYPKNPDWKLIRFQPHPRTRLTSSFYEINERSLPANAPSDVVSLLDKNKDILRAVKHMGQEKFEKYFLRADEPLSSAEVADICGIKESDIKAVQEFLLTFSVHSEFFDPSSRNDKSVTSSFGKHVVRLARLEVDDGEDVSFSLSAPHLARGRYDIQYDRFQSLSKSEALSPEEKRHLRAFVRRLELVNWRQNTLFRILDMLCHGQRFYIKERNSLKRTPITQRQMARQLSVAPSTVNRAIQDRSVVMPWGEELLLQEIFCSRKDLCVDVLNVIESEDKDFGGKTDLELQESLEKYVGFSVPRRTVNTYRNYLEHKV